MSHDLVFWRDERSLKPDPVGIYEALLAGELVPDLDQFAIEPTLRALAERFPGFRPSLSGETGHAVWESPDQETFIEFSWSSQHLIAITRGGCTDEQLNVIIDICVDIGGGRLYDPQVNERFDSQ